VKRGNAAAKEDLKKEFAPIALAAYGLYASTLYVKLAVKARLKVMPKKTEAT
jgi:hypothetical protein